MTESPLTRAEIASLDRTSAILAQAGAARAYAYVQWNLSRGDLHFAIQWQKIAAERAEAARIYLSSAIALGA